MGEFFGHSRKVCGPFFVVVGARQVLLPGSNSRYNSVPLRRCAQFNLKETEMRIGVLFPIAIIIAGVGLLVWFIASGAYLPGAS